MNFQDFFKAKRNTPDPAFDYQCRLACGEQTPDETTPTWLSHGTDCASRLIDVPTGLGKTAGVSMAWLDPRSPPAADVPATRGVRRNANLTAGSGVSSGMEPQKDPVVDGVSNSLTPAEQSLVSDLVSDGLSIQDEFRPEPRYQQTGTGHSSHSTNGAHSARVRMRLVLDDAFFDISQMGPDFLLLNNPAAHPPGRARIELQVDDSRRSWEVYLPHGIPANDERVPLKAASQAGSGHPPDGCSGSPACPTQQ
jgi:hypothetical protein